MTHTPWLEMTVTWLDHVTVNVKMYVCVKTQTVTVVVKLTHKELFSESEKKLF